MLGTGADEPAGGGPRASASARSVAGPVMEGTHASRVDDPVAGPASVGRDAAELGAPVAEVGASIASGPAGWPALRRPEAASRRLPDREGAAASRWAPGGEERRVPAREERVPAREERVPGTRERVPGGEEREAATDPLVSRARWREAGPPARPEGTPDPGVSQAVPWPKPGGLPAHFGTGNGGGNAAGTGASAGSGAQTRSGKQTGPSDEAGSR
jgi:hypothetical protein